MSRALRPATPSDDLEVRRHWRGATFAGGALTAEIAAFCESGVSVTVASVAPVRRPVVAQGLACRVGADGTVRVVVHRPAAAQLLEAIAGGAGIAATMSRPHDHRSIQIKGAAAAIAEPAPDDVAATHEQTRAFRDDLVRVGYPPAYAGTFVAFRSDELVAMDFVPTAAFVQTPGPAAGAALTP